MKSQSAIVFTGDDKGHVTVTLDLCEINKDKQLTNAQTVATLVHCDLEDLIDSIMAEHGISITIAD
jgi:hypothetical protein